MSEHDPFDGDYGQSGDGHASENRPSGMNASEPPDSQVTPAEAASRRADAPAGAPLTSPTGGGEVYTLSYLRRQDKADLQAIARDRGLDASGNRDALISRIATHQQQGSTIL